MDIQKLVWIILIIVVSPGSLAQYLYPPEAPAEPTWYRGIHTPGDIMIASFIIDISNENMTYLLTEPGDFVYAIERLSKNSIVQEMFCISDDGNVITFLRPPDKHIAVDLCGQVPLAFLINLYNPGLQRSEK